jgi:putative ATPase
MHLDKPRCKIFEKFSPRLSISVGDGRSVCPASQETPRAQPLEHGPLADRLRPRALDQVIGQGHLTGAEGAIGRMVAAGKLSSMILWGPPGTGKTSIARLLADAVGMRFVAISAIFRAWPISRKSLPKQKPWRSPGGAPCCSWTRSPLQPRAAGWLPARGGKRHDHSGRGHHRKPQLRSTPPCSAGRKCSSCTGSMRPPWANCCAEPRKRPASPCPHPARARGAGRLGRRRRALPAQPGGNPAGRGPARPLDPEALSTFLMRRVAVYDKDRDGHYNLISALHKSLRGSDPQAALYWLARMLVAGEEPLYVLRRLVRFASEDIGLADPQALIQCLAAKDAYEFLGSPEGELAIVQACLYCATAPKSNAAYAG